jgi:hypothetical protein
LISIINYQLDRDYFGNTPSNEHFPRAFSSSSILPT